MSAIHVQQIKAFLHSTFDGKIDLADYAGKPADEVESAFLSRALAAFCIMQLAPASPDEAAAAVTDEGGDNGIDAIYFYEPERILYVVQSKWRYDGSGSPCRGDVQKFITGFKDLVNARFDRFSKRVNRQRHHVEKAINNADSRLCVVVAYTGQEPLASEQQRDLHDLQKEMNDTSEILTVRVLKQSDLHRFIAAGASGDPIKIDVAIKEWGQIREPITAFYGHVSAADIAEWYEHHPKLFSPNIRLFLGTTEVNQGLTDTLRDTPEHFWYFNNGITVICGSIHKKPIGGNDRGCGYFECNDVSIVNGAQTVGAIASAHMRSPELTAKAAVFVKFIALENCPIAFAGEVTRATNTQNRIELRDFVALDPEQDRICSELRIDGIQYAYKSGELVADKNSGFDFTEAATAMACSLSDLHFAMQAKREIGKLWADITRAPYKVLFNRSITGNVYWHRVQIIREIDAALAADQPSLTTDRDKLFQIHGNRCVAYLVFRKLTDDGMATPNGHSFSEIKATIRELVVEKLLELVRTTDSIYPDSYLPQLFKNVHKCRMIINATGGVNRDPQMRLFSMSGGGLESPAQP